jgi:uncharacterized protein (TIGR03437 family)
LPTRIGGTQVLFDGVAAPLLYVDQDQINAVTPFGLTPGKNRTVRVTTGTASSAVFTAVVIPSQPAIFTTATGAAAVNQDGTINSSSNPAKLGWVVSIWTTGIGAVDPAPPDGQIAIGAQDYHCCNVYVSISQRTSCMPVPHRVWSPGWSR